MRSILYLIITPYNPDWSFSETNRGRKQFKTEVWTTFILASFLCLGVNWQSTLPQMELTTNQEFSVYFVGFFLGFLVVNLVSAYLLQLYVSGRNLDKLSFINALAIFTFPVLPYLITKYLVNQLDILPPLNSIIRMIGITWSWIIMILSIRKVIGYSLLKSIWVTIAIRIMIYIPILSFTGIEIYI